MFGKVCGTYGGCIMLGDVAVRIGFQLNTTNGIYGFAHHIWHLCILSNNAIEQAKEPIHALW